MSNGCAECGDVTNPIPAGQIVHVDFAWQCLTPPGDIGISVNASNVSTCITSELLIRGLAGAICSALTWDDLEFRCLNIGDPSDHKQVLQAIIDKACDYVDPNCPDCEEEEECCEEQDPSGNVIPNTWELMSTLNYCQTDDWVPTDDPCIEPTSQCNSPEPEAVDYMQATLNRIMTLQKLLIEKCTKIEELEDRLNTLQSAFDNNTCCNEDLAATVLNLQTQITNIQSNCC